MKSLFSGVSGLKNHTVRMDVIGNNIANVNTTAYKANTVTFRDVFYQTRNFASAGTNVSGGTNPRQVGYGLALGSIDKVMTQSGFTFSDSVYDCAIQGEGFFQVMDAAGNVYYTRNGVFNVDNAGNLVDSNGYIVLGVTGDPTGIGPSRQRINLFIPDVWNEYASATQQIQVGGNEYEVTFRASGFGPAGNIGINISHGEVPFATMNGSVLSVVMDLTEEFTSPAAFQDAVNAAIMMGGVNPGEGVLPLNIEFSGLPPNGTQAIAAANDMFFSGSAHAVRFEADTPGEQANSFVIAMRTSTSATEVSARWSQNVLTVTLPSGMTEPIPFRAAVPAVMGPDPADPDPSNPTLPLIEITPAIPQQDAVPAAYRYPVDLQMIQDAINRAAGMSRLDPVPPATIGEWDPDSGNANRRLNVSIPTSAAFDPNATPANPGDFTGFDIRAILGSSTRQVGLMDGEDNFYRTAIQRMSTVAMTNGRFAATQSVRDLDLVFIDSGGVIYGEHPVHGRLVLGRIDIAIFQNANGLQQFGTSYFKESLSSGPAEVKVPESDGAGEIVSGALEMANVDLSQEFSDMIITQRGFQANSRIITVSDTMLEELINLKR